MTQPVTRRNNNNHSTTQTNSTMATPIRENCLDANDQPNENAARVQAALDVKGCMCINRPGGRCAAPIVFDATIPCITCTKNPKHSRAAYEKPYEKIVFDVINAIEEEEFQQEEEQRKEKRVQLAKRKADEEAGILGLEHYEAHARPDGSAPEGKTWSFALGDWQDEDYLRSAKKHKKD